MKKKLLKILSRVQKKFRGHVQIGKLTIYGFNAMHLTFQYSSGIGYICFHPPMYQNGCWWPWYFYISPNGTPWAATYAIGPGVDCEDKMKAKIREFWGEDAESIIRRMFMP